MLTVVAEGKQELSLRQDCRSIIKKATKHGIGAPTISGMLLNNAGNERLQRRVNGEKIGYVGVKDTLNNVKLALSRFQDVRSAEQALPGLISA